ncbi:uncharacterized protein P884DRAFT_260392 [Thermothelomyces heterothallicus CBS 202.75]|uniref:uncharacterized protein n=1 Tax=Thermothelomyces heterothallicus CBS 202.75 TaxID=1149848 RepID=UPI0037422FFA
MAAPEFWDVVKREVRDMLVPGLAKRMEGGSPGGSPGSNRVRRDDSSAATSLPSMITAPPSVSVLATESLALASSSPTTTSTTTPTTTGKVVMQTTTAPAEPSESETEGMSVAAKAGIVIGALGGILVVFVLGWLVLNARRKKLARRRQQIEDDEKINGPFADSAAIQPTPNKTPRLSLRPVTQLLPTFTTPQAERRQSRGIALTLNPVSNPSLARPTGGSAWERPTLRSTMASPSGDSNRAGTSAGLHPNPFHDNNRVPDEPVSPVSSLSSVDQRVGVATTTDSVPEPVSPILGDDDEEEENQRRQQSGDSNLTRKASIRQGLPKPLDLTKPSSQLHAVPPSPAGTEYSVHSIAPGQSPGPSASAAAIAAAGGPAHSTVHRVQLDFKPTLHDEMELRAGQLVRLLHEYDDGWALCIRLDRSEQGVVPRTCLSTRPVKPRPPQGPGAPPAGGGGVGNQRRGPPVNPPHQHHNSGSNASRGAPRAGPNPGGSPPQQGWRGYGPQTGHGPDGFDGGDVNPPPGQAY